ncbi:MAG: nucleotidyltransferase family protein [Dehalococcoidia bacterium]|nr:nucleotidyltransferase family protein [Dehalococcoidia bacterium]
MTGNKILVSVILLAGGKSQRLGKPKLLLPFGDKTVIERSLNNVLASEADEIVVTIGSNAEEIAARIKEKTVKIAMNQHYFYGMGTSITAGLRLVNEKASAIVVALADQPAIDSNLINRLLQEFHAGNKGIVVPVWKGKRGHPVIFSSKYRAELLQLRGEVGGREIIARHHDDVLEIAVDSQSISLDIDTMEDYNRLIRNQPGYSL